jgi:hypothetical protein
VVFNATFNNNSVISWRSVLLVEETGVLGERFVQDIGISYFVLFVSYIYIPGPPQNDRGGKHGTVAFSVGLTSTLHLLHK